MTNPIGRGEISFERVQLGSTSTIILPWWRNVLWRTDVVAFRSVTTRWTLLTKVLNLLWKLHTRLS
jgi:hypothetical protein